MIVTRIVEAAKSSLRGWIEGVEILLWLYHTGLPSNVDESCHRIDKLRCAHQVAGWRPHMLLRCKMRLLETEVLMWSRVLLRKYSIALALLREVEALVIEVLLRNMDLVGIPMHAGAIVRASVAFASSQIRILRAITVVIWIL